MRVFVCVWERGGGRASVLTEEEVMLSSRKKKTLNRTSEWVLIDTQINLHVCVFVWVWRGRVKPRVWLNDAIVCCWWWLPSFCSSRAGGVYLFLRDLRQLLSNSRLYIFLFGEYCSLICSVCSNYSFAFSQTASTLFAICIDVWKVFKMAGNKSKAPWAMLWGLKLWDWELWGRWWRYTTWHLQS